VSKHFVAIENERLTVSTPPDTPRKPPINNENIANLNGYSSTAADVENSTRSKTVTVRLPNRSPYFPHKPRPNCISCLPFPPLDAAKFGLMQERLAYDPFRLLVATIFLNRTRGEQAMPVFFRLLEKYPSITDLATADAEDVVAIIQRLGFQNQRARKCVEMAKTWAKNPPERGNRYRKLNYPLRGDGKHISADEVIDDEDGRVGWEIAHLPGLGPYSHDSWRIFCRDKLRGLAESWNGEGAAQGFEPEWKRVLPTDKELRAYLTWMWLKEGWVWNKETGQRNKADEDLLERARRGGIVQEHTQTDYLVLTTIHGLAASVPSRVEIPAGAFMP
jgi:endonuclease III